MLLKWIAERLQMGTWTYVSNLLNQRPAASPAQERCRCVSGDTCSLDADLGIALGASVGLRDSALRSPFSAV